MSPFFFLSLQTYKKSEKRGNRVKFEPTNIKIINI